MCKLAEIGQGAHRSCLSSKASFSQLHQRLAVGHSSSTRTGPERSLASASSLHGANRFLSATGRTNKRLLIRLDGAASETCSAGTSLNVFGHVVAENTAMQIRLSSQSSCIPKRASTRMTSTLARTREWPKQCPNRRRGRSGTATWASRPLPGSPRAC